MKLVLESNGVSVGLGKLTISEGLHFISRKLLSKIFISEKKFLTPPNSLQVLLNL